MADLVVFDKSLWGIVTFIEEEKTSEEKSC